MDKRELCRLKYMDFVLKTNEYLYIHSYFKGDILPSGDICKNAKIELVHKYCGNRYIILASSFIKDGHRCTKCCGEYKNSIEYYVKNEFKLKPEDIFDYDKCEINPRYISKKSDKKIWVKCNTKDYHGSSYITCSNLIRALNRGKTGCSYCASRKVHPRDSFAQYHIDNTDKNFLEKYWDYDKNTISPWEISYGSDKKIWIKCQKKDYHGSYEIKSYNFNECLKKDNNGCKQCSSKKVHKLDSFGYYNFDKVMNWHPDNNISPFRVSKSSSRKFKFICYECGSEYYKQLNNITHRNDGCPMCSISKGEKIIENWLNKANIKYFYDQPYFKDLLSDKGNPLRPDFILPDYKIWIEYDGEFHYKDFYKDGSYELIQISDKRKDEYAKKHNWKLIRIPYWEFDKIEEILSSII